MYIQIIISLLIGYLIGSIPFALVIGKVFYKTDIRNYGSKNLGGGNAGRVLGKTAGISVMIMDILKVALAIFIASYFSYNEITMVVAGLSTAVGHCFPIFAGFKGGKAVATMYGFLFGMMIFDNYSVWIFLLPLISFLIILYISKVVALASIFSALIVTIYIYFVADFWIMFVALLIFDALIIWRHRVNITRIIRNEENKIKWM